MPGSRTHAEIVRDYNVPGECSVRVADWPYDCKAKDSHYHDHVVYVCDTHSVWWHEPNWQPEDA